MSDDAKFGFQLLLGLAVVVSAITCGALSIDTTETLPIADKGCYVEVKTNKHIFTPDIKTIKEFCETREDKR